MSGFRRKSPEEILRSISQLRKGRLKIIIGPVSGSGKTYHMLNEGKLLKQQGLDVVICAISTMQRSETVQQTMELERVPSIHWRKDGKEFKDLPLEAILARNPEVLLVDGLAHRNRKEAKFKTRLEDIRYLMERGISIITTINVYELDGVDEIVYKRTGIRAEETVPADTLELADEVRLIDVSPETMLKRIDEGVLGDQTLPALARRGNLGILREISLRLMAEGVNDSLEKHRQELGLVGPSGAAERILVSAQYHWNGSLYVRRGQQIAKRLNGDLLVVTFVLSGRKLSKDQQMFKRSIRKLAEKIDAGCEELPLPHLRKLPSMLVRYAIQNNVTRIVMGHSQKSRRQERWQGSIAGRVLRKMRNVDVFLMADRAKHEGERILPIKAKSSGGAEPFRRLSSKEIERKIETIRRGTFKIYIGAAPGAGKTYKMLQEGNSLQCKGIDVVIGLLETHGRKETAEQIGELPLMPRTKIAYRSAQLEEMDTEAVIARHPEVVLVDELAHTNVPGSRNKKRYEDVIRILESGISVISTLNVQHLESLNDAVEQLTGVRVRETVPDAILKMADEVELIDVTPQMLQQRMRDGKIYAFEKVDLALGAFFKIGNLIALRELALREIADDVDERLESWERNTSQRGPGHRQEVIFVCVDTGPRAERLIRRGFRIAHRLKAEWYVHYVHRGAAISDADGRRLETLRHLCERLGGRMEVSALGRHRNIGEALLQRMVEVRATQLVIGQSRRPLWYSLVKETVVHFMLRRARWIDMLIVADFERAVSEEGLQ